MKNLSLAKAQRQLMTAIEGDELLQGLTGFAENGENNTDLFFDIRESGGPGETLLLIGGDLIDISMERGICDFIDRKGLEALGSEKMVIQIVVNQSVLRNDTKNPHDELQVLVHEYAVHATKFPKYIMELRRLAVKGDKEALIDYIRQSNRGGFMDALEHHKEYFQGQNQYYAAFKNMLPRILDTDEMEAFGISERTDLKVQEMDMTSRQGIDMESVNSLVDRTEDLNLVSSFTFKKQQKKESGKKNCFITTACVRSRGLPDDCHELETLRRFRDGYMRSPAVPDGERLIEEYYRIAPRIVEGICRRPEHQAILSGLYTTISKAVACIDAGKYGRALDIYKTMVADMKRTYFH